MSDVSGIPYMGPMGQGNFFAPQFPSNPQINPTAGYAGPSAYAQDVTNNLYSSGGGFGQQTNYYSGLGAQYSAAGMSPYGVFTDPGQGGGASPYHTTPDVWTTGASPFQGGGGSNGLGGSIFGSGLGGGSSGPSIDWGNVGRAAAGLSGGVQNPYPGMSMPGGLGSPFSAPSGASPFNWSDLWGGGSARADPTPGMAMPGGLGSPMTMPQTQQQPNINWGNVGAAAGSSAPYTSGIEPDQTGGQTFAGGTAPTDPFPGMAMPGGLNSPMAMPQQQATEPGTTTGSRTYDFAPMFEGGGGGFGTGAGDSRTYEAKSGSLGDTSSYFATPDRWDPQSGALASGPSAEDMAAQARARLAEAMARPQVPTADESTLPAASFDERFQGDVTARAGQDMGNVPAMPDLQKLLGYTPDKFTPEQPAIDWSTFQSPATDYGTFQGGGGTAGPSPFDRPSQEEFQKGKIAATADVARPPDKVDMSLQGRIDTLRDTVKKELEAMGLHMTSDYRGPGHELYRPGSKHSDALAFDTRAHTPEQADAAMGKLREMFDARGMTEGRDYKFIDEVRSPIGGITKGPHVHTTLTPEGMQRYQQSAYDVGAPRPPADIPYPQGIPLPQARPEEAPGTPFGPPAPSDESINAPRPPANIPNVGGTPFVNDGTPFGPPVPADYKPPAAAPVKHTGLELARANIDTPIEKIAMERGGQKAVDQVSSMAVGMTPRQLMQSYGGMFMSRAEPLFASLGITRSDFEKAVSMPQTKQDLKMRFGEGGDFGPYPAYTGPEAALGGGFPDFRQSENIEDRRGMPDAPPGVPGGMPNSQNLLGYTPQQWSAEDYPASFNERFGGDASGPATSMADFQSPANSYSAFQGAASPENRLEAQRAGFAASIRDNPEKSLQLAARLYSEDQNSPTSRQAILEAMLNAQQASGRDPLDLKYYPKDTAQYRAALAKLSGNNDLLNRIYQEMETPFSGSNRSNYATDWASGGTAADERKYTTSTWTSPTNEQFFRKDISNDWTGLPRAAQNQKWYQTTSGRAR